MITRLRAQNFKSWKDTGDLRIAPLTGLFGTNSSGKTSVLQALLLLKQSVESLDPGQILHFGDERSALDLGTFSDVIHGHDLGLQLKFSVFWREIPNEGYLDVAFRETADRLHIQKGVCALGEDVVRFKEGPKGFIFSRSGAQDVEAPWPWIYPSSPSDDPTSSLRYNLQRVHYLGPLRQRPQRAPYIWSGNQPWSIGPDGAQFAEALLATMDPTVQTVAYALKKMKLIDSFRIERVAPQRRDWEIRLRKTESSAEVLLPDVGFGVSQVLPVLVLCYYATEGSTLVIEQPELHLHPAAQSELADVLMDVVKNRNIQIILESHSEHLLRRLQRRIAEGEFAAKDAALYFCEMDNGASKCTELQITEEGTIKNWPKDFFGDEMGELAATTKAAMKRRLARVK